ncbi:MAG: hypothetical protein K2I17_05495 [Clostridia bacterium]|nr:hypothetical protein [Clostridia bacterium]
MQFYIDDNLSPEERNIVIRYTITIGTRARCSTRHLMRPFKTQYLREAQKEKKAEHQKRIAEYKSAAENYVEGETQLGDTFIQFFGGIPSKKRLTNYYNNLIKQEKDNLRMISRTYSVHVDYGHISPELLKFHNSLNPRPTFGYSNSLHEECDFELTEQNKAAFLSSSLAELPSYTGDWMHDHGYVFFDSIIGLMYEDLAVFKGDRCILSTVSHEGEFDANLSDEELEGLRSFEDKKVLNEKIIEQLKAQRNG